MLLCSTGDVRYAGYEEHLYAAYPATGNVAMQGTEGSISDVISHQQPSGIS
jgi:hypothetical protein